LNRCWRETRMVSGFFKAPGAGAAQAASEEGA